MASERRFPIQNDGAGHISGRSGIPWSVAQRVHQDYTYLCLERGQTPRSLEDIASAGGWGFGEAFGFIVEAAEVRERPPDEDELTKKARAAFGEMGDRPPGHSTRWTGGAW